MILIGIGANLAARGYASPLQGCLAALDMLRQRDVSIIKISRWYYSRPYPPVRQPWFINGVIRIESSLTAEGLLILLHSVESFFGRVRLRRNEARCLDLDLLDYRGLVIDDEDVIVPHPRLHERGFVLYPLRSIEPDWRHPRTGETIEAMLAKLPPEQEGKFRDS